MALLCFWCRFSQLQVVVEEKLLKQRQLPPLFVVGMEGFFGAFIMLVIVLPVVAYVPGTDGDGVHENAVDSAHMLGNSTILEAGEAVLWYPLCNLCSLRPSPGC